MAHICFNELGESSFMHESSVLASGIVSLLASRSGP